MQGIIPIGKIFVALININFSQRRQCSQIKLQLLYWNHGRTRILGHHIVRAITGELYLNKLETIVDVVITEIAEGNPNEFGIPIVF